MHTGQIFTRDPLDETESVYRCWNYSSIKQRYFNYSFSSRSVWLAEWRWRHGVLLPAHSWNSIREQQYEGEWTYSQWTDTRRAHRYLASICGMRLGCVLLSSATGICCHQAPDTSFLMDVKTWSSPKLLGTDELWYTRHVCMVRKMILHYVPVLQMCKSCGLIERLMEGWFEVTRI